MWRPYKEAIREKLPHAKIIADRFHVMKQLNHQINRIRRALQKKATADVAEILKGSRWLFLKNRDALKPEEEEKLRVILEAHDELR
ncbi:MAG: transposase [bacterium]